MKVIYASNAHGALRRGIRYLREHGVREDSRNGPVVVAPGPVCTVYRRPWQHVLFGAERDANPFFHLFEALWMLGGRNDVAFPAHYAAQLQLYSDDNVTLNGAYGFRWRSHFGYDQINLIVDELSANPASRRCVLAMWDANDWEGVLGTPGAYEGDLKRALAGGKDVPCNTHVYFRVRNNELEMTVCNRSNDAVWGAYGANYVHFGMLQEYMAGRLGLAVGLYYQFANNFHVYSGRPDVDRVWDGTPRENDLYKTGRVAAMPMISASSTTQAFEDDLADFLSTPPGARAVVSFRSGRTAFFTHVVWPMFHAHALYKQDRLGDALSYLPESATIDWLAAGRQWLLRRQAARAAKAAL